MWLGSAFNCTSHEISLFHSVYESTRGAYGECGDIVGQSLPVINNTNNRFYVSQLRVPIRPDTTGKTTDCQYDNGIISTSVGQLLIVPAVTVTGTEFNGYFNLIEYEHNHAQFTIDSIASPEGLHMSNADLVSRYLTFTWSSGVPDCPAIHYNILASNCGSCPTTTNHTTVTCTDIATNNRVCTFAVQAVFCGNITGNLSDPISVTVYAPEEITVNTSILYPTEAFGVQTSDIHTVYTISFLGTALIVSVVASIILIIIILTRYKARIKVLELQLTDVTGSTHMEPMYEDVTSPLPSVSVINTQDNVAYGHMQHSEINNH